MIASAVRTLILQDDISRLLFTSQNITRIRFYDARGFKLRDFFPNEGHDLPKKQKRCLRLLCHFYFREEGEGSSPDKLKKNTGMYVAIAASF